jgi:hypothetical protein
VIKLKAISTCAQAAKCQRAGNRDGHLPNQAKQIKELSKEGPKDLCSGRIIDWELFAALAKHHEIDIHGCIEVQSRARAARVIADPE